MLHMTILHNNRTFNEMVHTALCLIVFHTIQTYVVISVQLQILLNSR